MIIQIMSSVIIVFCLIFIGLILSYLKKKSHQTRYSPPKPSYPVPTVRQPLALVAQPTQGKPAIILDKSPLLLKGSNLPALQFDAVDARELERFPRVVSGNDGNSLGKVVPFIHQIASTGTVNGVMMSSLKGVYKATVDPARLIRYSDGTFSSMQQGANGISAHHGFQAMDPAQVFTPMLAFQIASIITGQYYLNGITKQLNEIARRLKYIVAWLKAEKEGKLESNHERLSELSLKTSYALEDAIELAAIKRETVAIRKHYEKMLDLINEDQIASNAFWASKQITQLKQLTSEQNPSEILDCIIAAKRIEKITQLVELRCNVGLAAAEPSRFHRIRDLIAEIKNDNDTSLTEKVVAKYKRIMNQYILNANNIYEKALRESTQNEAKALVSEYKSAKKNMLAKQAQSSNELKTTGTHLLEKLEKTVDVVLFADTEGHLTATQLLHE